MKEKFDKWAADFFNSPKEPINPELSQVFMACLISGDKPIPDEIRKEFLFQVIERRVEHIGLTMTDWEKVFIMYLTKSPGSAIMYLYALRSVSTESNMQDLANKFPMGFLSEFQMKKMWEEQKDGFLGLDFGMLNNMLDIYQF
jgi:hypothetical protein